jgi:hypothetical protein
MITFHFSVELHLSLFILIICVHRVLGERATKTVIYICDTYSGARAVGFGEGLHDCSSLLKIILFLVLTWIVFFLFILVNIFSQ